MLTGIKDLDKYIFGYLSIFDLIRIKRVCKYFAELCSEDFFKQLLYKRFPSRCNLLNSTNEAQRAFNQLLSLGFASEYEFLCDAFNSKLTYERLFFNWSFGDYRRIIAKNIVYEVEIKEDRKKKWSNYILIEFGLPGFNKFSGYVKRKKWKKVIQISKVQELYIMFPFLLQHRQETDIINTTTYKWLNDYNMKYETLFNFKDIQTKIEYMSSQFDPNIHTFFDITSFSKF
jgi:hypothetical protein